MNETPGMPELKGFGKDILSDKEKIFGSVATLLLIGAAIVGLNAALPFINNFLGLIIAIIGKTFALAGLLALVGIVAIIAMHPRTHTLIRLAFYGLSRSTTKMFIKYSPTAILEIYSRDYLDKKAEKFAEQKLSVEAQRNIVASTVEENRGVIERETDQARVLKERHYDSKGKWDSDENRYTFQELSTDIGFREKSNKNLERQLSRMDFYLQILEKLQRAFRFRRNVINNFVEVLTREYNAMKASAAATQSLASVFGTDDMKKVFEMAVDFMKERIAFFAAQVDNFMQENTAVLAQADLENEVQEDLLFKRLEAMDKGVDFLIGQASEEQEALSDPQRLATLLKSGKERELVPLKGGQRIGKRRYLKGK